MPCLMFEVPFRLTAQTGSIAHALNSSLYPPCSLSLLCVSMISMSPSIPYQTPHVPAMIAPNVIAAAAHIAYGMQPPESLHRTKHQIKATKNQDLEHTELEMLITMNVHIPLLNHPLILQNLDHLLILQNLNHPLILQSLS